MVQAVQPVKDRAQIDISLTFEGVSTRIRLDIPVHQKCHDVGGSLPHTDHSMVLITRPNHSSKPMTRTNDDQELSAWQMKNESNAKASKAALAKLLVPSIKQ